ncbi:MAG: hypothetical protein V7746_02335 [Halioglobus sp.]
MIIFRSILSVTVLSLLAVLTQAQDASLTEAFAEASYKFDLEQAELLLPRYEQAMDTDLNEQAIIDFAGASLLVAELKRGVYEQDSIAKKEKRVLGREIDKVAGTALTSLERAGQTSERYRLEADLLGTMIRSKFKGMKYQPRLEKALETSLLLDGDNANTWVSMAKRPLFALPHQGGDPQLALENLNRALALDPGHVQALLFRGAAHAKLDQMALAEQDWAAATALNPNTADARDRLMAIEIPGADTASK